MMAGVSNGSYGGSSSVASVSNGGSGIAGMSHRGGDGMSNRGYGMGNSCGNSRNVSDSMFNMGLFNGDGVCNSLVDWSGEALGHLLDGVGAGLVNQGLLDGLVGPHGSMNLLGSESGDVLEDWLRSIVGVDDGVGLVGGNRGGDMGMGGLSHRVGQGGNLGADLSESMRLGSGVGKVSSKPVMLNGSAVMGRGPHKSGSSMTLECNLLGEGHAGSHEGEVQEGVHGSC